MEHFEDCLGEVLFGLVGEGRGVGFVTALFEGFGRGEVAEPAVGEAAEEGLGVDAEETDRELHRVCGAQVVGGGEVGGQVVGRVVGPAKAGFAGGFDDGFGDAKADL